MIYEPGADSFLLEKVVRSYAKGKSVLDMGAGSGIISKTAIESGASRVLAVDVQSDVVAHLKKQDIPAIKSDLFAKVPGEFDLIAFNPPYLPDDEREDRESRIVTSGGKRGDEIIVMFLQQAVEHLKDDGVVMLVVSSLTPKKRILEVLKKNKFKKRVVGRRKFFMETLEVLKISRKNNNQ